MKVGEKSSEGWLWLGATCTQQEYYKRLRDWCWLKQRGFEWDGRKEKEKGWFVSDMQNVVFLGSVGRVAQWSGDYQQNKKERIDTSVRVCLDHKQVNNLNHTWTTQCMQSSQSRKPFAHSTSSASLYPSSTFPIIFLPSSSLPPPPQYKRKAQANKSDILKPKSSLNDIQQDYSHYFDYQNITIMESDKAQQVAQPPQEETHTQQVQTAGDGPKLSKNEQKRLEKQKKLEQERAEKAAKRAAETKDKPEKEKEILDPTQYFENRSKMVNELKKNPETYPYPHKFHVKITVSEFIKKYDPICVKGQWLEEETSLAGRVTNIRKQGKNLVFIDIKQEGESLQVMCSSNNHKGNRTFEELYSTIRRGDIIGVVGLPGRTNPGELSIAPGELKLLSPCLHMLPDAHTGFKDRESRYRKRYLDLIMNNRVRETFITRSKVLGFVRRYLNNLNFVEVETPMMNMIPGGATARPFMTYHNDLDMKLYMRIAPELYLKQLIVGGLERVFQIGKNFRNESIDQTHNPQYTACEFYMAYADYEDLIHITEDMLSKMVKEITGSFIIKFHPDPENNPDQVLDIDFTPPWRRINMLEELEKCLGVPFPADIESKEAEAFFDQQCKLHKVDCSNPRTTIRLIDKLVGKFLESQCLNPTFIVEHPQMMSPLAKYHRSKPGLTERFQLFIKYHEFCNAYTELNDPFVQKQLFLQQVAQKEKGDDESMFYDEVFVNALEHALPPTGGWGLGIDRTVMMITDHIRIQEVLLFPAMKPEEVHEEKQEKGEAVVAAKVEEKVETA